jgi:hypothetical protein
MNRPSASLAPRSERAASGTGSRATAGAGTGSVPMSNAWRGETLWTNPTIARMWSGVVPQHPPTSRAPASTIRRA